MIFDAVAEVYEPSPVVGADLVVDGVAYRHAGSTPCQVQPLSQDAAFRLFGVEADRAFAVYAPLGSAGLFDKVGTRLIVGEEVYTTVAPPEAHRLAVGAEHVRVAARWLEWRPDTGAGGGRQAGGGGGTGGLGSPGGVPL